MLVDKFLIYNKMSIDKDKFDHSKLSNPRIVGPGGWKALHLLAKWSDINNNDSYAGFVRFFCHEFKCGDCREHCSLFLSKNAPEKYKGQKWGMSRHSMEFHNAASKGLGKPQMDWNTYKQIWLNKDSEAVCQRGCGDKIEHTSSTELSEVNFVRLKVVSNNDPSLVQVRRASSPVRNTGKNITLIKKK